MTKDQKMNKIIEPNQELIKTELKIRQILGKALQLNPYDAAIIELKKQIVNCKVINKSDFDCSRANYQSQFEVAREKNSTQSFIN